MMRVYFELIFMVIVWSFSFVIVDIAVEFIPPLSIALYRFIIASCTFLLIDIYFKVKKKRDSNSINKIEDIYLNELMKTKDANEGLAAFMEKRQPVWKNK